VAIRVVSIISRMNVGGPAILLTEMINSFDRESVEHILITGRCESNEVDYLTSHEISGDVIYMNKIQRSILPFADLRALINLIRILRRIQPDIVHTHTSKAGVLGRIAAKIANPRTVIIHTYHGHILYGYFSKPIVRLVVSLERFLSRFTNVLVAVSNQVKSDLSNCGIGKKSEWEVIHPGIKFKPPISKFQAKLNLNIDQQKTTIAWVGRFTDIKNPNLAIETMQRIVEQNCEGFELIMVGGGELLESCQKKARDLDLPVRFTGVIDNSVDYLAASELLLITSNNEGMPLVLLEAASQRVPAVSTAVGGIPDFILDGVNGYLVDANAEQIASVVRKLAANEGPRSQAGEFAFEEALQNYTVETSAKNHLKIYVKQLERIS